MFNITIDGTHIEVEKGTTVIQAAETLGIEIPRYCYHPGLSIVGVCRICLVEIERMPRLQVACYTPVTEGMVVHTNSEKVREARRAVLEFLLVNHPLDCPVCDQAGECWLQNYYMEHGLHDSQMLENKVKKHKAFPIGPNVMLDSERCILCSRCVRFCDEITETHELGIFNRGDHAELLPYDGVELDNKYSGNTIDICPVGALTDRDFRFRTRVWYLSETPSVCPGCSRGCNIYVHHNDQRTYKAAGTRIARLKPRYNPDVNDWWMCDAGRYGFPFVDAPSRLLTPQKRIGSEWQALTWAEILTEIAAKLTAIVDKHGVESVGVVLSPQMSNEDLFLAKKVFRQALALRHVDFEFEPLAPGDEDDFLIKADKNPNTRGARELQLRLEESHTVSQILTDAKDKRIKALYICHHPLEKGFGDKEIESALSNLELMVFQGSNGNQTSVRAGYILPSATFVEREGTFTNFGGRVQRIRRAVAPLGQSKPDWVIFKSLLKRLGESAPYFEAGDVFEAMVAEVPSFAGLSYATIGEQGVALKTAAAEVSTEQTELAA
ncbi:MAG: molybdopterin-dependent oxidoreductase [bacterium]